jgi:hypothetical protein
MANAPLLWLPGLRAKLAIGSDAEGVAEASGRPNGHAIVEWIHLEAIQLLVRHASAVIATLLLSALVGFLIQRVMRDGPIKHLVILIDQLFVAGVILFLVAEMAFHFWQK